MQTTFQSHRRQRLVRACLIACLLPASLLAQGGEAKPAWSDTVVTHPFLDGEIGRLSSDRGLLLVRSVDPRTAGPQMMVFGQDGEPVSQIRLDVPGVSQFRVYHAAALGNDGSAVVSGAGWESSGPAAAMLCFVDAGGTVRRIVRTNPFLAKLVRVAPDGTIWALGTDVEHGDNTRAAPILARFSPEGLLLSQHLPRGEFPKGVHPASISNVGSPFLWIAADRVGILTSESPQEWLEVDFDGKLLGRWPAEPIPREPMADPSHAGTRMRIVELALTASGRVIAWLNGPADASRKDRSGLYEFQKDGSGWTPREPPAGAEGYVGVLGADGERIVMAGGTRRQLALRRIELPPAPAP